MKTIENKNCIVDQNCGLTPLEICDFWHSEKLSFLQCKKVSLVSRMSLNIISSLVLNENNWRKKLHFWPKWWVNPFGRTRVLGLIKIDFAIVKKRFLFYLDNHSTLFPVLFWPKTTTKKFDIFGPKLLEKCDFGEFELLAKKVSFLSRTLQCIKQGLKLTKFSGRLFATTWRNIVARCKFLVASLYSVNDAAQGLWYFARLRGCEIQVNPRNSQKHAKYCEIRWFRKKLEVAWKRGLRALILKMAT